MKSEPGPASMAEQVAWTVASFPRYSSARAFDAAMDAETERKPSAVIASALAPHPAEGATDA